MAETQLTFDNSQRTLGIRIRETILTPGSGESPTYCQLATMHVGAGGALPPLMCNGSSASGRWLLQ